MEKLKALISSKFGEKYSFIKPFEVVYNIEKYKCTLTFLFPETEKNFTDENKREIADFLREKLDLNAKVEVNFRKSFLDKDIVVKQTTEFFKIFHQGIFSVIKADDIEYFQENQSVSLKITIAEKVLEMLDKKALEIELIDYLKKNFCGEFACEFLCGENLNEEKLERSQRIELQNILRSMRPTARYEVFAPVKIVGKEITPQPEFMSKIKGSKESVILAGKIENLEKKSYKRKRDDKEIEKFYYKFNLREENQYLRMVYFCPKANITKMDKLVNGDSVLVIANIKKENQYLSGTIKSLSLCQIDEDVRQNSKEKIVNYSVIFPEPYAIYAQANIFDVKPEYSENIKKNTYVVFDVETTGLDADKNEIIEIGAVKMENGAIKEKFQTLVKPKGEISKFISNMTGITNEMVEHSPPIEVVIKDFWLFAKNSVLAGYNVAFDQKFIQNSAKLVGLKFANEFYDVMPLAKQKISSKNYKLSTIVEKLKLTLDNAHRAFFDALATAEVLLELSKV